MLSNCFSFCSSFFAYIMAINLTIISNCDCFARTFVATYKNQIFIVDKIVIDLCIIDFTGKSIEYIALCHRTVIQLLNYSTFTIVCMCDVINVVTAWFVRCNEVLIGQSYLFGDDGSRQYPLPCIIHCYLINVVSIFALRIQKVLSTAWSTPRKMNNIEKVYGFHTVYSRIRHTPIANNMWK